MAGHTKAPAENGGANPARNIASSMSGNFYSALMSFRDHISVLFIGRDMSDHQGAVPSTYDPNRLLDTLMQELRLPTDDDLGRALDVEATLIRKIRHRLLPVGPSLLIRMSEISNKNVRELRYLMGDRRAQYRLTDAQGKRRPRESDEAGLPNFIQWA